MHLSPDRISASPRPPRSDGSGGGVREANWQVSTRSLFDYMADCRRLVLDEFARFIPRERAGSSQLYELVYEYPLREAKALRPALCIAVCRALGSNLAAVLPSAAVLELYHNAFLVHDDVEDGSERRRSGPTLHRSHGVPIAVNVGDAMLALALEPLLENTRVLTLGKALRILECVARMARESAEGQALELEMIRSCRWTLSDRTYFRMVHKKTSHYSFIAPIRVGALAAGATDHELATLTRFATWMGVAFQIQDDLLNLSGEESKVGKEIDGDLWEGKHTLILAHALRQATATERQTAEDILRKNRPTEHDQTSRAEAELSRLQEAGRLTPELAAELRSVLGLQEESARLKTTEDIAFLKGLVVRHGSLDYARRTALRWAGGARRTLDGMTWLRPSVHRDFLFHLTDFVVARDN